MDLTDWRVKVLEAALDDNCWAVWEIVSDVAQALREELAAAARLIVVECEKEDQEEEARKADDAAFEKRLAAKQAAERLAQQAVVPKRIDPPTHCLNCGSDEHALCNRKIQDGG